MIYSVWNPAVRLYDVYETAEVRPTHAAGPGRTVSRALGASPEEAAWRLPMDARKTGTSAMPKGRIASTVSGGGALGDVLDGLPSWWPVAAVGLGYLAWRMR